MECSAIFHRGKPNIKARVEKIKRICQHCGEEFFVYPSDLKFGKGKYCSIKCSGKSHSGKNNAKWKGGKIKCVCQTCGEEFYRFPSDMKNGTGKFCSRSCSCKSKTKENGNNWKGGTSFVPYCPKFNERRKEAVREFFGRKCLACGADEAEFKTRLPVHHVDHDKEQGCNGKPFNLVPFCSSCHSKEIYNEEEYTKYINKTLEEGFKWGIWNEEEYIRQVMYPDD